MVEKSRPMTLEDAFLEKLRALSPEQKQEVLEFVEFLYRKYGSKRPTNTQPPTPNTASVPDRTA